MYGRMMAVFDKSKQGFVLRVRISPNSSSCSINGTIKNADEEDFLKISVIAVPEKGKANKELIAFLAKKLKIAKSKLEVISGETDRWKRIAIEADNAEMEMKIYELIMEAENGK